MRQPLVVANWKMNMTAPQAEAYCRRLRELLTDDLAAQMVICPPFPSLQAVRDGLAGTGVKLGAQNFFPKPHGAYTGEVSIEMLQALGCEYVIVGHSERRTLFSESAETISEKVKAAVEAGLTPILCVGETMSDRSLGLTNRVIGQQLLTCLKHLRPGQLDRIVVAYEPLWAIGTGRSATPHDAAQVADSARQKLKLLMDGNMESLRVLYGGSVNAENMTAMATEASVDGALVGGASLDPDKFLAIAAAYGVKQ